MKAKPHKKAKPIKQSAAAATSAKCQSCPHTINFFSHFQPDGMTKNDFENAVLVWGFFTGANKLFPLHLPALEKISELAFAGNQPAASLLVQIATRLNWQITALEKQQPNVMREIARKTNSWPIVATTQHEWERDALSRLTELGLGQGIRQIDSHFRKARGCDKNYIARCWAKTAVRCVMQTRFWQHQLVAQKVEVDKKLGQGTWKRADEPAWVSVAKGLPDYSAQTQPKWAGVIREMIREELPQFHQRSEWENQRKSCEKRNRNTKGQIQNAILDNIVAALKTITPVEINKAAENSVLFFNA